MNSKSSGGRLEAFFTGKGFYIVLLLCAAVIGISAWMMAAGDRRMAEDIRDLNQTSLDRQRVETVILPAQETMPAMQEAAAPAEEAMAEPEPAAEDTQVWREEPAPAPEVPAVYVWPVSGLVDRMHSLEALAYDATMRDWRTHAGIDIEAAIGTTVTAAHAGTVSSIRQDDLLGTMVTVDHGDGVLTVYANLETAPAVKEGDWVEPGSVIGAVGDTALCEIGQPGHLHFAVRVNGAEEDPLAYLPA